MSGGHFRYDQYKLQMIADEIEQLIIDNESEEVNQYGDKKGNHFSKETIKQFKAAVALLRVSYVYVQRVDWLVSGDDGEDSFHRRLDLDLEKIQNV
jgi:hypothetical protein